MNISYAPQAVTQAARSSCSGMQIAFSKTYVGPRTVWPRPNCKHSKECHMGKYVLGWLLGVPVFVLVIVYLIFN